MVGVRFRRALFPGYSDTVNFTVPCSGALAPASAAPAPPTAGDTVPVPAPPVPAPQLAGEYRILVSLQYRKVDQFLLNYLFGETNRLTAPVTEIASATTTVKVLPKTPASADASADPRLARSAAEKE